MDRGAWRATVLGVVKSHTRLRDYRQAKHIYAHSMQSMLENISCALKIMCLLVLLGGKLCIYPLIQSNIMYWLSNSFFFPFF